MLSIWSGLKLLSCGNGLPMIETIDSCERGMNPIAVTIINP